jgi:uncharacterized protein (DUF488 family)
MRSGVTLDCAGCGQILGGCVGVVSQSPESTKAPRKVDQVGILVRVIVWTIGHGTRPVEELVSIVREAGVCTLVDVRRFPGSRHNPQFNEPALRAVLEESGIGYRHAVELGGRLAGEPGEDAFGCLRVAAFRSYAARMRSERWQAALATALAEPAPCLMCSETLWWRCHRRLIAELLHARGDRVVHLLGPGKRQEHKPLLEAESRDGRLYLCGALVA